jgi:hypothetical protein
MTLNEKISNWFEPKPTWIKTCSGGIELILSIGGAWLCPERCITATGESDSCVQHIAVGWDTDEAANAMLLEAMPEPSMYRSTGKLWRVRPDGGKDDSLKAEHLDRKIAIRLAFTKWAEIEKI